MIFRQLFDSDTSTYTYILADEASREAVIIDPVLGRIERDLAILRDLELKLTYALDTHIHADHVTALGALRERTSCETVASERAGTACHSLLVRDGSRLRFGRFELEVRETPGHTDGCLSFVSGDGAMVFTGDALLIRGTGRTDFQQGDPKTLYRSITEKIFTLPDSTLVYPGHDYEGRTVSTVGEEKRRNPRLGGGRSLEDFVEIMEKLDLPKPRHIDVALPANLACGGAALPLAAPDRDWAPVARSPGGVVEVTPSWLAKNLRGVRLVDVREPDELRGPLGSLSGSENVPLDTIGSACDGWDREAPLVLVCRSGGRSGQAAAILEARGFRRIASLQGGMVAWNELQAEERRADRA